MSRDIKYIGMDVHKEAIVNAVLNGGGKLVMESIVETKASSILQCKALLPPILSSLTSAPMNASTLRSR